LFKVKIPDTLTKQTNELSLISEILERRTRTVLPDRDDGDTPTLYRLKWASTFWLY